MDKKRNKRVFKGEGGQEMIRTIDGIDSATCGQITRLEKLGFSGKVEPFVYGYIVSIHTKEYERLEQKNCKDIYELIYFLEGIK